MQQRLITGLRAGHLPRERFKSRDIRRGADAALTAELKRALPALFAHESPKSVYMCFPCRCGDKMCHRVMLLDSAMKSAQRKRHTRLPCSLCDQNQVISPGEARNPSASSHVEVFAGIVKQKFPDAKVIWEWNCIAADTSMSIDATVLCGYGCAQFEIDGSTHFSDKIANRSELDKTKDGYMCQQRLCVLRLHHKDQDEWAEYIEQHIKHPQQLVHYTKSYWHCLQAETGRHRVLTL